MSNSPKKTHEPIIRQNEEVTNKPQKHEVNIKNNSSLYFQIGLIICLLISYGLLEMKFETRNVIEKVYLDDFDEPTIDFSEITVKKFEVQEPETGKVEPKQQPVVIENPIIVDDDKVIEDILDVEEKPKNYPVFKRITRVVEAPSESNVTFVSVENVPVYPGCENKKTNAEKRKCLSEKIRKLVQRNFDTDLAKKLGLKGEQVIETEFTINRKGYITNVKATGNRVHPVLKKEAGRVIGEIPKMVPGKQQGKYVDVIYNLPIRFHSL